MGKAAGDRVASIVIEVAGVAADVFPLDLPGIQLV